MSVTFVPNQGPLSVEGQKARPDTTPEQFAHYVETQYEQPASIKPDLLASTALSQHVQTSGGWDPDLLT